MRPSTLLALAISTLPLVLAAPRRLPPLRTLPVVSLPPDLYESAHPSFAGAEIVLRDPLSNASSTSPGPGRYAISYTPYTQDGRCKSPYAMAADVARIHAAGFSAIRLYATDCGAVSTVGNAAVSHNLHLILGLHITEDGISASALPAQLAAITTFASQSSTHLAAIDAVLVGNEALFNALATPAQLANALRTARATLRHAGYTGPVSTTEPLAVLREHARQLCPHLDMPAANLLPFFSADVRARDAANAVKRQTRNLQHLCPAWKQDDEYRILNDLDVGARRAVLALELGWPSAGRPNGLAVPGRVEQRVAMQGMAEAVGSRAVFASFADDEWREPGDFGVETHWGSVGVFE